jgi:hypothetical protein
VHAGSQAESFFPKNDKDFVYFLALMIRNGDRGSNRWSAAVMLPSGVLSGNRAAGN